MERGTEETLGAIFWIGGVSVLNKLGDILGGKLFGVKNAKFDAAKLEFSKIPENSSLKEISKNLEHYQGIKQ